MNDGEPSTQTMARLARAVPQASMDCVIAVLDAALVEKSNEERKVLGLVLGHLDPVKVELVRNRDSIDLRSGKACNDVPGEVNTVWVVSSSASIL